MPQAHRTTRVDELRSEQLRLIREEKQVQREIGRRVLEGESVTELRQRRAEIREQVEDLVLATQQADVG